MRYNLPHQCSNLYRENARGRRATRMDPRRGALEKPKWHRAQVTESLATLGRLETNFLEKAREVPLMYPKILNP